TRTRILLDGVRFNVTRNLNVASSPFSARCSPQITRISGIAPRYMTSSAGISVDDKVWKLGRLNHVAVAVPDLKKAIGFYKNVLGAQEVSDAVPQPEHGVYTVFVNLGNTKIELLHPYGMFYVNSFGAMFRFACIYVLCDLLYTKKVNDVKAAVEDLVSKEIRVLDPEPKIGAHGNPVVFLHPRDCGGVLVELEEVK
ncbi:8065_t:CDS:2, partial [Acaulospora morrowiae]